MSAASQNFKSQGEAGARARETPGATSQALDFIEKVRNGYTNLKSCCLEKAPNTLLHESPLAAVPSALSADTLKGERGDSQVYPDFCLFLGIAGLVSKLC